MKHARREDAKTTGATGAEAGALLEASGISVRRDGRVVLAQLSADLRAGCWTAVVGPNGAGKSTLLRALAGLQAVFAGEVRLAGRPLADWTARERARRLAWLGQDVAGDEDLRVDDAVMLGRLPHRAWFAPPAARDVQAVRDAMRLTGCLPWRERRLEQLSGGQRQRVMLARLLAVEAEVLLMDEPLASLDPPFQADWVALARALAARGAAVVSVLHELNAALQADALLVLREGRVTHHGAVADARTRQALEAAFDGRIRVVPWENRWIALT